MQKAILVIDDHISGAKARAKKIARHFHCQAYGIPNVATLRDAMVSFRKDGIILAGMICDQSMDITGTEILHELKAGTFNQFYPTVDQVPIVIITGDESLVSSGELGGVKFFSKSQWSRFDKNPKNSTIANIVKSMLYSPAQQQDTWEDQMAARSAVCLTKIYKERDPTGLWPDYEPDDSANVRKLKERAKNFPSEPWDSRQK